MKWYDYIAVFWFADLISAFLIHNPLFVWIPIFSYLLYENIRQSELKND
jgi:hypothetical protein